MRKLLMAVAAMVAAQVAFAQSVASDDNFRQAVQGAVADAEVSIKSATAIPGGEPVAILPIFGDSDGLIAGQLKIALTRAGKTCVEGKEDPAWSAVLKEIEWDARKLDILDPMTVDRFGRVKSAKMLMYAFIRSARRTERFAFFEMEIHVTSIATKKHLWGGVFAKRYYVPNSAVEGLANIPVALRDVMQGKLRNRIADSLKGAGKLAGVRKIAFLPFAGDTANYAADIVRDAVARTDMATVNLDIATLGEARLALRDQPGEADALIYGSLRDLSIVQKDTAPHEKKYELTVEIQACIEKTTREQLWSDTICITEAYEPETGWWSVVCTYCPYVRTHPWLLVAVPLAVLILLWLIWAHTRVR